VAFTFGILRLMSDNELEAITRKLKASERDILISSIAATLAAAITMVARMAFFFGGSRDDDNRGGAMGGILMLILAPIAAMLIQMAISRSREYARRGGCEVCGLAVPMINGASSHRSKRIHGRPPAPHVHHQAVTGEADAPLLDTPRPSHIARLQAIR
jgi:heat shock protein HtpX